MKTVAQSIGSKGGEGSTLHRTTAAPVNEAALVMDGDRVVGIVTMLDIMGFSVHGADHDVGDAAD